MAPLMTIAALQEAYRGGRLSPLEVAEACLARAEASEGAFITVTRERALREAAASTARWRAGLPRSPLDGIPVSWKDMIDVAGVPTTAGSRVLPHRPASRDASAVARLARCGAVCIGKTGLSEFAFSGLGLNPWYGSPRNPHSPAGEHRVCGGSSSGAAASVALGICAVGIGTDTSGSVRVPAAFTGLFGWKPARGSWPMGGVRGLAPSLDALGVIANTIEDVALVHMALRKAAEPPVGSRQLRVIVADEPLFAASDPAPRENALVALRLLEQQGLRVEMRSIPEFRAVAETFRACGTLVAAEAWRRYRHLLGRPEAARIDPLVRSRLEAAGGLSRAHYRSLTRAQEQLSQALRARGRPVAYAVPTTPNTAPLLSEVQEPEGHARVNARTLQHTMLGSFLDLPGLSVPSGADASGLPTGLLLSALPEDQEVLLELGRSLGSDLIRGGS